MATTFSDLASHRRSRIKHRAAQSLTYVVLATAAIMSTLPVLYLVAMSFTGGFTRVVDLSRITDLSLENFSNAWTGLPLGRWILNSIVVVSAVVIANLFLDSLAGYAFAKMRFAGRDTIFLLLLSTMMIPVTVILLPTYFLATRLGLLNTYAVLILPALAYPLGVFLMRQFIRTLPSELLDAARIDGLSEFGIYRKIILPLVVPPLAVLGLFTLVLQWSSLLWPLVVATSNRARTVQPGIATLPGEYITDWGLVAAATLLSMVPILLAFLFFQKYIVRGVFGGRVLKG